MNENSPYIDPGHIPLSKALLWIILSTCLVSGTAFFGMLYFQHINDNRRHDPKYHIVAIVQTSPDQEGLKTAFLAELLDLSIDNPKNLYNFNSKEAQTKLLHFPVIKEATVNKIKPGILWVDYSLRKPVAYLADFSNTLIDADAVPFPAQPFFTPKRLPEVYLGLSEEIYSDDQNVDRIFQWGSSLQNKKTNLAFTIMQKVYQSCCSDFTSLSHIDVSKAFASSYGQRQIVVVLEDRLEKEVDGQPVFISHPKILRLSTENFSSQLINFKLLQAYLRQQDLSSTIENTSGNQPKSTVIDLRLSDLAFISKEH